MVVPSIAGSRCRHPPRLRCRADLATAPLDGGSGPTTWTPPARRTKEDTPRLRLSTDRSEISMHADPSFVCFLARRCIEIGGLLLFSMMIEQDRSGLWPAASLHYTESLVLPATSAKSSSDVGGINLRHIERAIRLHSAISNRSIKEFVELIGDECRHCFTSLPADSLELSKVKLYLTPFYMPTPVTVW
ncbi:hypothetical protein GW17_00061728 [Ensete ventricosum]|nr:hypothetical protein GW17_00061728 [Ensete ventricosum]